MGNPYASIKEFEEEKKRVPIRRKAADKKTPHWAPRPYIIILHPPLDTAQMIQMVAGLQETPAVEQAKTLPEDIGETEKTVNFCRLALEGYDAICEWFVEKGNRFHLEPVEVVFEGGNKEYAYQPTDEYLNSEFYYVYT
jgi:hypothetical protein